MAKVCLAHKENKIFEVSTNSIIFDALEKQGEKLPHGCLAGSCGACRIEIISGAECLSSPGTIEADTIKNIKENAVKNKGENAIAGKTIRLSCRAKIIKEGTLTIKPFRS